MEYIKSKSRAIESILAFIGAFISLMVNLYLISGGFLADVEFGLTIISIIGSILGFYGIFFIEKHKKNTIPLLLVSVIMILFGFSPWNVLGAFLVLLAAIYLIIKY